MTPTLTIPPTPASERILPSSVVAAPNISRDEEPIEFKVQLAQPSALKLTLYDLLGEKVYQVSAEGNAGLNTIEWGLVNSMGNQVASGLYIYVLEVDGASGKTNRMGRVVVLH